MSALFDWSSLAAPQTGPAPSEEGQGSLGLAGLWQDGQLPTHTERALSTYENKQAEAQALGLDPQKAVETPGLLTTALKVLDAPKSAIVGLGSGLLGLDKEGDELETGLDHVLAGPRRFLTGLNPFDDVEHGFGDFGALVMDEDDSTGTRIAKGAGAFVGDVLSDPLTYATFGLAPIGKKAAAEGVEQATKKLAPKIAQLVDDGARKMLAQRSAAARSHKLANEMAEKVAKREADAAVKAAREGAEDLTNSQLDGLYKQKFNEAFTRVRNENIEAFQQDLIGKSTKATVDGEKIGLTKMELEGLQSLVGEAMAEGGDAQVRRTLIDTFGEEAGEQLFDELPEAFKGGLRLRNPFKLGDADAAAPGFGGGGRISEQLFGREAAEQVSHNIHRARNMMRSSKLAEKTVGQLDELGPQWTRVVRGFIGEEGEEVAERFGYPEYMLLRDSTRDRSKFLMEQHKRTQQATTAVYNTLDLADDSDVAYEAMTEALHNRSMFEQADLSDDQVLGLKAAETWIGEMTTLKDEAIKNGVDMNVIDEYMPRIMSDMAKDRKIAKQSASNRAKSRKVGGTSHTMRRDSYVAEWGQTEEGEFFARVWDEIRTINKKSIEKGDGPVFIEDPMEIMGIYSTAMTKMTAQHRLTNRLHDAGLLHKVTSTKSRIPNQKATKDTLQQLDDRFAATQKRMEEQLDELRNTGGNLSDEAYEQVQEELASIRGMLGDLDLQDAEAVAEVRSRLDGVLQTVREGGLAVDASPSTATREAVESVRKEIEDLRDSIGMTDDELDLMDAEAAWSYADFADQSGELRRAAQQGDEELLDTIERHMRDLMSFLDQPEGFASRDEMLRTSEELDQLAELRNLAEQRGAGWLSQVLTEGPHGRIQKLRQTADDAQTVIPFSADTEGLLDGIGLYADRAWAKGVDVGELRDDIDNDVVSNLLDAYRQAEKTGNAEMMAEVQMGLKANLFTNPAGAPDLPVRRIMELGRRAGRARKQVQRASQYEDVLRDSGHVAADMRKNVAGARQQVRSRTGDLHNLNEETVGSILDDMSRVSDEVGTVADREAVQQAAEVVEEQLQELMSNRQRFDEVMEMLSELRRVDAADADVMYQDLIDVMQRMEASRVAAGESGAKAAQHVDDEDMFRSFKAMADNARNRLSDNGGVPDADTLWTADDVATDLGQQFRDDDMLSLNTRRGVDDEALSIDDSRINLPDSAQDMFASDPVREFMQRGWVDKDAASKFKAVMDRMYTPYYALFKQWATVNRGPGYHMRNSLSGTWNNFIAGVTAKQMKLGVQLAHFENKAQKAARQQLEEAGKSVDPAEVERLANLQLKEQLSDTMVGDHNLWEILQAARAEQIASNNRLLENMVTSSLSGEQRIAAGVDRSLFPHVRPEERNWVQRGADKAANNRYSDVMRSFAETNEAAMRYGAFLKGVKEHGIDLDDAGNVAGAKAASLWPKATQFDYLDVSPTERQLLRHIIPFMTWSKNNVPYAARSLAYDPGKVNAFIRAFDQFERVAEDPNDPDNQLVPSWMKDKMGFTSRARFAGNPVVVGMESPLMDLNKWFEADATPVKSEEVINNLNPVLKVAAENITGASSFTGSAFGRDVEAPWWAVGATRRDPESGNRVMSDRVYHTLRNLAPPLGQAERLVPTTDASQERWATSVASNLAAAPVSTLTPNQVTGALNSRNEKLRREIADKAAESGLTPDDIRQLLKDGMTPDEIAAMVEQQQGG